jgi:hypothetical protein
MLTPHGYAAWAVGKWHLTPEDEEHLGATRVRWPLGKGFERNGLQRALARPHGVFNPHLQRVERRALAPALFGSHGAERAHQAGDAAFLAEFGDAYCVQRVKAGGGLNGGQRFLLDGCNVGQVQTLPENQRAV